jgi:tetratricopeptide (TPR) repeat protein
MTFYLNNSKRLRKNSFLKLIVFISGIIGTIIVDPFPFTHNVLVVYADRGAQTGRGTELLITSRHQFDFAGRLFQAGDYFRSISEYKRFIYLFPDDGHIPAAYFNLGMAYFHINDFSNAVKAFAVVITDDRKNDLTLSSLFIQSYFMISRCYLKGNAPEKAISNLNKLMTITTNTDVHDEALYRAGWIFLEMGQWDDAKRHFSKISIQNQGKYKLQRVSDELTKVSSIPHKNPKMAGLLSVIPGAGYVYCRRYKDALIAFLLNGTLIYAAYESFRNDNYALGGLITAFELGFYTGNIYGSATSAHKFNRAEKRAFIDELKHHLKINLSGSLHQKSLMLSFNYLF